MNKRVLFVDDEPNILQAIKRAIRKEFDVTTAVGPEEGLKKIADEETFAIIVSDMRMPGMNGVDFLRSARQLTPDSVRVMLTGNSDQQTAVDAVNDGEVFRFLTKPCDVTMLRHVIKQGLRQYQLVTAERELLDQTLRGSIGVMGELLALARPNAFGRTSRLHDRVMSLVDASDGVTAQHRWDIETATMLSQLGCVTLSTDLLDKINSGEVLTPDEETEYAEATIAGAKLLAGLPRMEAVVDIIAHQHKNYDGSGLPNSGKRAENIPLGARCLKLILAQDALRMRGLPDADMIAELRERRSEFDPRLLKRLLDRVEQAGSTSIIDVSPDQLLEGMVLAEDVSNDFGSLLVCEGQRVSASIRAHLVRMQQDGKLTGTFKVAVANSAPPAMTGTDAA